jgi:hypothetical protein
MFKGDRNRNRKSGRVDRIGYEVQMKWLGLSMKLPGTLRLTVCAVLLYLKNYDILELMDIATFAVHTICRYDVGLQTPTVYTHVCRRG